MKMRHVMILLFLIASESSWAYEAATARVTTVQSTYMPTNIQFSVDTGTASCPAGHWLTWSNPNIENNKATYATLLAALISATSILYYINNSDTTCTVVFLDILAS